MRGSRLLLLAGAGILVVVAILLVFRYQSQDPAAPKAAPQRMAVIALKPIKFGENLTPENIVEKPWPADLPEGAFTTKAEALTVDPVGNVPRMAMRPIAVNELVTRSAVSGEASRLSSSPLLGANMRAVAVPLNEATGAGGFVQPGDRVDLFLIRRLEGEANNTSIADLLVQNVRVLAVGQTADTTREEAVVVRTATLELSPAQAQKVALGQNVGVISVALRSNADETTTRVPTIRTNDLRDGPVAIRAAPRRIIRAPRPAAVPQADPAMTVVRGTESAQIKVAS